jgi:hypothetical protein
MTKGSKLSIGLWSLAALVWTLAAATNFYRGHPWIASIDVVIVALAGANVYMRFKNERLMEQIKKAEEEMFGRMKDTLEKIEKD